VIPSTMQCPTKLDIAARLRTSVPARPWQLAPLPPTISTAGIKPTRREFLIGAGSLLVLGAAGCGSGGSGDEGASGGTRTIEHKYGSTEISGTPQRVVTVGFTDQDPALALGVAPVAVRDWFGEQPGAIWPWARDELGGAEPEVLPATELNFEQIAALEPDLIVGVSSGMTEEEYGTLSEIAPTLAQPGEFVDFGVPWQDQTRLIGRALGLEGRAEELVTGVEARFEEAREQHPEFQGATGVIALTGEGGNYYPYGPEDVRGRFLTSLGFELPPEVVELAGESFFATISREQLSLVDAGVLVWIVNSPAEREALTSDPLYQRLGAVQEGRDIFLEANEPLAGALSFGTVLSLPFLLDEFTPRLEAALDGAPAAETTMS
jgi:iron complex transport system substrate-binding protein